MSLELIFWMWTFLSGCERKAYPCELHGLFGHDLPIWTWKGFFRAGFSCQPLAARYLVVLPLTPLRCVWHEGGKQLAWTSETLDLCFWLSEANGWRSACHADMCSQEKAKNDLIEHPGELWGRSEVGQACLHFDSPPCLNLALRSKLHCRSMICNCLKCRRSILAPGGEKRSAKNVKNGSVCFEVCKHGIKFLLWVHNCVSTFSTLYHVPTLTNKGLGCCGMKWQLVCVRELGFP